VSWVTFVDGVTSTVADPRGSVTVTVPPETAPTTPRTWSLPLLPAAGPGVAPGAVADGDELAAAGLLLGLDDGEDVLDEPHAANDSAVRPTTATTALRRAWNEMTMVTAFLAELSVGLDEDMRSLWMVGWSDTSVRGIPSLEVVASGEGPTFRASWDR